MICRHYKRSILTCYNQGVASVQIHQKELNRTRMNCCDDLSPHILLDHCYLTAAECAQGQIAVAGMKHHPQVGNGGCMENPYLDIQCCLTVSAANINQSVSRASLYTCLSPTAVLGYKTACTYCCVQSLIAAKRSDGTLWMTQGRY